MPFLVLLILFVFIGAVLGWTAAFKLKELQQQVNRLQNEITRLHGRLTYLAPSATKTQNVPPDADAEMPRTSVPEVVTETASPREASQAGTTQITSSPTGRVNAPTEKKVPAWQLQLRENWMIWLGGCCVGLAGIFLVKYSFDQGYIGPAARVIMGVILGLVLHGLSGWLRSIRGTNQVFSSLAAGGSITLFAALLAALHLYDFLNPALVFFLLAVVALGTMLLAVVHGHVLAIIGMLGAYLVPLMVGEGPGGTGIVLTYVLIISASVLLLMSYVQRNWLWAGVLIGSLGWFLLTLDASDLSYLRGLYLAALAYLLLAFPDRDWMLRYGELRTLFPFSIEQFQYSSSEQSRILPLALLLVILAQLLAILNTGFNSLAILTWLPLPMLLLVAAGRRESLLLHPWILLLVQLLAWCVLQLDTRGPGFTLEALPSSLLPDFYWYCLASAMIFSLLAINNLSFKRHYGVWSSLAALPPLLFLTLAFLLSGESSLSWQWSVLAVVLSAGYVTLATTTLRQQLHQGDRRLVTVWLLASGHLGYSLAIAIYFEAFSITLALSLQIISLAWLIRKFRVEALGWLLKGVVAVIITRLTLNPWLLQYSTDIHWSLWTYGGSALCCYAGSVILRDNITLRQWAQGAFIHLLALTVWAEIRYWLYDGNVYSMEYSFTEAALNTAIFATLALVYHYREQSSQHLVRLYRIYSQGLMGFAVCNYVLICFGTANSVPWVWQHISDRPVFNLMLLAFGLPVLLGGLSYRYYLPKWRRPAAVFTGVSAFFFISLEIRHLWQGDINLHRAAYSTELYTYSTVWLIAAILLILGGAWRYGQAVYKAGMALLLLVIVKLFLVDMSDLQGLLRVASFMGMGIGLLAIAYLHQRLGNRKTPG